VGLDRDGATALTLREADEWAMEDLPAARELIETIEGAELFLYPGDRHLFAWELRW
jgi:hypothetical protein